MEIGMVVAGPDGGYEAGEMDKEEAEGEGEPWTGVGARSRWGRVGWRPGRGQGRGRMANTF